MKEFMKSIMDNLFPKNAGTGSLLYKMEITPLSNVPFHENTPSITRFFANGFPMHLDIHEVSPIHQAPPIYAQMHKHDFFDEINIIMSKGYMQYMIQLGDEEHIIENNTAIWIPKGTMHSANVLKGAGYFISMRINDSLRNAS